MAINILGQTTDLRSNTLVIYAQLPIKEYLTLVGDDFDKFAIQRKREKHKAYARMENDIKAGALLPAITLAVEPQVVPELVRIYKVGKYQEFLEALRKIGHVKILDGLQRTYILKALEKNEFNFDNNPHLLVEFWLEEDFRHLIYRIIVLNAGQKPMSMRHQIEILFSVFKNTLEMDIDGLELLEEREEERRTRARKYAFDRVVSAYQCFLTKSPEVQKENIVAQRLMEEDVLSGSEETLSGEFNKFKYFLNIYAALDDEVCRVYDGKQGEGILRGTSWFGSDNVLNAFFAAVADFVTSPERSQRTDKALSKLHKTLRQSNSPEDPLGLVMLQEVIRGFNVRKVNVGNATRKLMFTSFKEFFREEGDKPLQGFWLTSAD